ncbi:MAG: formate--tetrahydrofolate ligase [Clostridiales bacterium]|jgi:formate--tetrahydrofolate ligase|nr:formate--tetrahydrofolate ligase [Clostridiales bacterium]
MKTDIEIANGTKLKPIEAVAASLGIAPGELYRYGEYMAKVAPKSGGGGKVILVTAINPTPAGEGKTTVSIGLADALSLAGHKTALALREPSLGPVFGIKGGAAGGGYSQIAPMEDINLHFTGDMHAVTAANNLLSAMTDNHIYWGNKLKIRRVEWRRCLDVNDRALRNIVAGLGFCAREDSFDITAASEVMAVLCLAADQADLKKRLGDIIAGFDFDDKPVFARDLKADEAMAVLLKDAIKPNLVQTLGGTAAFVHGGPFANIAHGCNSVIATRTAMRYADYVVTEAGFGADLGAEKFIDIKCRAAGIAPSAAVIVATVRALKSSGGKKSELTERDDAALKRGIANLEKHIENITGVFNLPCAVAINRFESDSDAELQIIKDACAAKGVKAVAADIWARGGAGGAELAATVAELTRNKSKLKFAYELADTVEQKIEKTAVRIYGAAGVKFEPKAVKSLERIKKLGADGLPVCVAKTQYSLSDNAALTGRPSDFTVTVRDVQLRSGAGFTVAVCGDILLMPGLSAVPNAEKMTINGGTITGLF